VGLFRLFGHKKNTSAQKLLKQYQLQVKTNIEALIDVLQWFDRVTKQLLPERCRWQCQLAISEGFTNTVRYAHKNLPPTTPIDIEIDIYSYYLEIRIWDWGPPFDLHAKLAALRQSKENPLEKESDRGLFFMQELTDDLQYVRISNQRNCLVMRKRIISSESLGSANR
jgi:serine/threonine-protein kinase RsbW